MEYVMKIRKRFEDFYVIAHNKQEFGFQFILKNALEKLNLLLIC